MSAATERQENVSRLFFETFLNASGDLTDFQQQELERRAFDRVGGIYPNAPERWKENYYKQITAIGRYFVVKGFTRGGWRFSRGDLLREDSLRRDYWMRGLCCGKFSGGIPNHRLQRKIKQTTYF